MSEPVRTFYVAYGMQKDSPFTAKFSATFARLIEGGFLLKWTSDEMDKVARIADDSSTSSEAKAFVFDQIQEISSTQLFHSVKPNSKNQSCGFRLHKG